MLKEAIQYIVGLKDNNTYEINGDTYSDNHLHRIPPHVDRPSLLCVNGLDSIVKLVRNELDLMENYPVYIRVVDPRKVSVFTTFDSYMERDSLYEAICDAPKFVPGWENHEATIIKLRSMFQETDDLEYLLHDVLGRISKESAVSSEDNGISQTVEARQGIAMKASLRLKPRVTLRPYRTFTEVDQPASEFLLRLDSDCNIGLLEADGGNWKLEAKANIAGYLEAALSEFVADGKVVVMM